MNQTFHPQFSLRSADGRRKYLTPDERQRFIDVAGIQPDRIARLLCLSLAHSGCRISEALALTAGSIDAAEGCVAIRSLKKRGKLVIRTVPLPDELLSLLSQHGGRPDTRLCPFSRTKAWLTVKSIMRQAQIGPGPYATPKGLRHGFGIHAVRSGVPLNLLQRWLGHARISTTAIYADAFGAEERELARKMW